MALTTYTYSIATDFPATGIDPGALVEQIRSSSITTALDGVDTNGDVCNIVFKATLPTADKTLLDGDITAPAGGLIAAHDGIPIDDSDPKTATGVPLVQTTWREGSAADFISFNWCDKTTWYADAARVTDETLTDSGDGLTWNSANVDWICVSQGRIPQEHNLVAMHGVIVKVDTVVMTESSPGTTDQDYQVAHATGDVIFNVSQAGKAVTVTYCYAQTSVFYVTPDANKTLRLTAVEVQFTDDVNLTDSVQFDIEGFVEAFAPQMVDDVAPNYTTTFPTGTRIPLKSPRIYQTMMDFIAEAQRAYPLIPALGGTSWRGLAKPVYVMRWPYQEDATRDLVAVMGMRIKIALKNDIPFGGTAAIATLYAVSTNGS